MIYLRLLSALPRIDRESLSLQKYRDTASQRVGTLSTASPSSDSQRPPHNPTNPIIDEARSEAIRTALLDKLDDIMGFKSYRNLPPTPFDPSKLPPYMHIAPDALPPESYGNLQTPTPPGVLPSPAAAKVGTETDLPSAPNHASSTPAANSSTETVPTPVLPLPTGEGRGEGDCSSLNSQPSTGPNPSPGVPSPAPVPPPSDPIENQNSKIENPQELKYSQEICPKCNYTNYPLPGLLPTGERPDNWCANCGTLLPPPPTEACGHLQTPTPGVPPSPAAATPGVPAASEPVPAASD